MEQDAVIAGWIILALIATVAVLLVKFRKSIRWIDLPVHADSGPMPRFNIDGTPMPDMGGLDTRGKPLGHRHWLGR